jgi:CHASE2 domain-containing sensor protein
VSGLLGTAPGVFLGLHVILLGAAAFMTGQAVAGTWRPAWQAVLYGLLLGLVARFLTWSLFDGELLSLSGYLCDAVVLVGIALFAFRVTQVRKMVTQYPWLYRRKGLLGYEAVG